MKKCKRLRDNEYCNYSRLGNCDNTCVGYELIGEWDINCFNCKNYANILDDIEIEHCWVGSSLKSNDKAKKCRKFKHYLTNNRYQKLVA